MVFSRAASSLLVYVSLFHLYFLHLVDSQCPRQFQCGNLGNLSFPLADISQPGCGLIPVECGAWPNPKIHLDNKYWPPTPIPYEIMERLSANKVLIRNQFLRDLLNDRNSEKRCHVVLNHISLPYSPSISISFFPNITLFKCDKGINYDEEIPKHTCQLYNIYYPNSSESLLPPNGCSVLQLPRNLRDNLDSLDLFELLGADFHLEWNVSSDCLNCLGKGGNCTTNTENEFRCDKDKKNFKNLKKILAADPAGNKKKGKLSSISQQVVSEPQVIQSIGATENMSLKYDVEKYDGRINFGLWQVQVRDLLIQTGQHKALKGKPTRSSDKETGSGMSDDDWEELDLKAASTIRLCLAKNVLANIHGISAAKELWEKLEELYQTKSLSNRLYLKEQFHSLRMEAGTKISDHLSALNGIVSELEAIGVKIDDEDKALRLIWSLPSTYEHIKPILMYGKETVSFAEVTSKLISEERRLGDQNIPSDNMALVTEKWKRDNSMKKKVTCWNCGQTGHVKRNCPKGRAGSANYLGTDNASILAEEDVM